LVFVVLGMLCEMSALLEQLQNTVTSIWLTHGWYYV